MKIKTKELLSILSKVKPGLAKKDIIEQATHFIFTKKEILTYNDQICIVYPFETDFECSISADEFYKILSSMGENVEIDFKDDKLLLKSSKTKAKLSVLIDKQISDLVGQMNFPKKWNSLPEDFLDGLFLCIFSTSKDVSHPYLSCIFVDGGFITSSDNQRISEYEMKSSIDDYFLIPAISVIELIKFEVKEYALGESWVYFRTKDNVVFCSRIVAEEYPSVEEFFEFESVELNLPDGLKQAVEISSILAEGDFDVDKKIEVNVSENKITCKGEKEIGWVESEVDTKSKKEISIKFAINPSFFIEILDKTSTMRYGEDKALFVSDNFRHLISLFPSE